MNRRYLLIGISIAAIAAILPSYAAFYRLSMADAEVGVINAVGDALRKNPEYLEYVRSKC